MPGSSDRFHHELSSLLRGNPARPSVSLLMRTQDVLSDDDDTLACDMDEVVTVVLDATKIFGF